MTNLSSINGKLDRIGGRNEQNIMIEYKNKLIREFIGKILRKTSLDELPQLINILRAEMSFIGPRPWITDYYDAMNEAQRHRNDVRPGITGLAQAMGRNTLDIFQKISYDLEYIRYYSLWMDIKVVLLSIKAVFTAKGADAGKGTIQNELEALKKDNK